MDPDLERFFRWSKGEGVVSHLSALEQYGLSDSMSPRIYFTVDPSFRACGPVPKLYRLYVGDLKLSDVCERDGVPITTVERTLIDCAQSWESPEFVRQAVDQCLDRGLLSLFQMRRVARLLGSGTLAASVPWEARQR